MSKKYRIDKKSDMRKFQRDLKKSIVNEAKKKFMSTGKIKCPGCKMTINLSSGIKTCPNCGNGIDVHFTNS